MNSSDFNDFLKTTLPADFVVNQRGLSFEIKHQEQSIYLTYQEPFFVYIELGPFLKKNLSFSNIFDLESVLIPMILQNFDGDIRI